MNMILEGEALFRHAAVYLRHFKYLPAGEARAATMDSRTFKDAVVAFQREQGLPDTGHLNGPTARLLGWPRCGVTEVADTERLLTGEFRGAEFLYFVEALPPGNWDDLIGEGCRSWSQAANLKLTRTLHRQDAAFVVSVGLGPRDGFDGPLGTLAMAHVGPPRPGQQLRLWFDLAEHWVRDPTLAGILFLNVFTHELGHILGLDHSRRRGALMFPTYAPGVSAPQVEDDVTRAQAIYGSPPPAPPTDVPGRVVIRLEVEGVIPGFRVVGATV